MTYVAICILNIKVSGIHMNPDFGCSVRFSVRYCIIKPCCRSFPLRSHEVTQVLTISNPPSVMRLVLGFTLPLPYLHDVI